MDVQNIRYTLAPTSDNISFLPYLSSPLIENAIICITSK